MRDAKTLENAVDTAFDMAEKEDIIISFGSLSTIGTVSYTHLGERRGRKRHNASEGSGLC